MGCAVTKCRQYEQCGNKMKACNLINGLCPACHMKKKLDEKKAQQAKGN